jgi:integrase
MTTYNLSASVIKTLQPPSSGNRVFFDSEVSGFGLRVTANGARSFILNYRTVGGRERRKTIGAWPIWTATDARREAARLRHLVDQGGDPLAEVQAEREAPTMAELADRFEQEHLPRKRSNTATDYKRMLNLYIRPHFGNMKVSAVDFVHVDRLHREITKAGHHTRANAVVRVMSRMFTLSMKWKMRSDNPAKGIEKNHENQRRRYMKGDELAKVTAALAAHPGKQAADIIRFLLLTGCRRGEALSCAWADIDLSTGTWSKPASSTKQKENHSVPLSAPVRLLLARIADEQVGGNPPTDSPFVFPSDSARGHRAEIKRDWASICKAAGIVGLRIHDLRHSFASELVSGGASLPLIGALLGHSNVSTTQRYSHLYDSPQRAAVEKVGKIIDSAGNDSVTEPVPLRRK